MINDQIKATLLGLVRHFLTVAGGGLVANGYLGNDDLSTVVGAAVAVIGVAWSAYDKHSTAKVIADAKA